MKGVSLEVGGISPFGQMPVSRVVFLRCCCYIHSTDSGDARKPLLPQLIFCFCSLLLQPNFHRAARLFSPLSSRGWAWAEAWSCSWTLSAHPCDTWQMVLTCMICTPRHMHPFYCSHRLLHLKGMYSLGVCFR